MQRGQTCHRIVILCLAATLGHSVLARGQGYSITFEANSRLFSFNPDTGSSTFIGNTGVASVADLGQANDGTLFAASLTNLYTVNPLTAATTSIGAFGATTQMVGLDFRSSGTLLGVSANGGVFQVNATTGAATTLFSTGLTFTGDIAFQSGNIAYATASFAGGSHLIALDLAAQTTADRGLIFSTKEMPGLDFTSDGRLLAFALTGEIYNIVNFTSSGAGTLLSTTTIPFAGVTLNPVPEPTTFWLVLAVGCWFARPR